jgi:hypothetical protein
MLHLLDKLTNLSTKGRRNEFLAQSTFATANIQGQDEEWEGIDRGDEPTGQRGPGVHVNVTKVGLCPDLLAHTRELLVDEEEARNRACSGSLLEHSCGVHDAGRETGATFWKRMGKNCGEEGVRQVVETWFLKLDIQVVGMIGHPALHLVLEVLVRGHRSMRSLIQGFGGSLYKENHVDRLSDGGQRCPDWFGAR